MNKLSFEDRARNLHLFCEGNSILAITRVTSGSKNTVTKLLIDTGKACMVFHDANVRNVQSKRVKVDEIDCRIMRVNSGQVGCYRVASRL